MADGGQSGKGLSSPAVASPGSALERAGALAGEVRGRFLAMSAGRRRWMLTSLLTVAAMCAGMMWYAARPDWIVLFSGLDAKDTQQVAQELSAAGIPYRMTADGSGIEVDADEVDKARMEVASKGMPQSGRMGFELFDKPNWVGSEFDEKVNYQRALEGELERTIGTIAAVRSARVHIVLPEDSLFGDRQSAAKASVVLQLRRSSMPPEQVEAIRSLVAGAVEGLSPDDVTLVDADGRLNLNARGPAAVEDDEERSLEQNLVAMLEPTVGNGNVRATVNVSYDQGSVEKTDEVYDPTQVATLTMHKSEQTMMPKQPVSGVPGTVSNTPAAAAPGSMQAAGGAAGKAAAGTAAAPAVPPLMKTAGAASPGAAGATTAEAAQKQAGLPVYPQSGTQNGEETATDESGSYAVSQHLTHTEQGPGQIRRVTAAVVVNDRMTNEGVGKLQHAVWKPRTPQEMQQLQQLAQAAVGFDATRGDQVVVENVGFSSNVPVAAGSTMQRLTDDAGALLNTQPGLLKTVSVAALGLLLVMAVLKPMTRQMMTALGQTPPLALPAGSDGFGGAEAEGIAGRAGGGPGRFEAGFRGMDAQRIHEHVSAQIRREPAQSTRVLESWIGEPMEEKD